MIDVERDKEVMRATSGCLLRIAILVAMCYGCSWIVEVIKLNVVFP